MSSYTLHERYLIEQAMKGNEDLNILLSSTAEEPALAEILAKKQKEAIRLILLLG